MRYAFLSSLLVAPALVFASAKLEPTHRQASILKPAREGTNLALSAFVLDPEGQIVAAVRSEDGAFRALGKRSQATGWIQVYAPDKKLLREIPLPFAPTAIALTADGHYLAAGNGKLCKTTPEGKIVENGDLMQML